MSAFREWLETLADAEAVVPARVVLEHFPESDTGEARSGAVLGIDPTIEQLAAEFGRSPSTVRGWRIAGEFPNAYQLCGREWRIPRSDVEAFIERQRPRAAVVTTERPRRRGNGADELGSWRSVRRTG